MLRPPQQQQAQQIQIHLQQQHRSLDLGPLRPPNLEEAAAASRWLDRYQGGSTLDLTVFRHLPGPVHLPVNLVLNGINKPQDFFQDFKEINQFLKLRLPNLLLNRNQRPSWTAFCDFLKLVSALNPQPQRALHRNLSPALGMRKWWQLLTWGFDQNQLLPCATTHSMGLWPLLVEALVVMVIATETIHGEPEGMTMVGVKMKGKMRMKMKEKEKEKGRGKTTTTNTTHSGLKRRLKHG